MSNILPSARMLDGTLHFNEKNGFDLARKLGAFHLEHPRGLDFSAGIALAQNYYFDLDSDSRGDNEYRGFRQRDLGKSLLGYSHTGNDQDELLQIECGLWREYFPDAVADLLWAMNDLNRMVLAQLFKQVGIEEKYFDQITGGMSSNDALQYCIFNHFRSNAVHPLGLTAHKDSGFTTLLYTTEPGLESLENGSWIPFDPLAGHFTMVLGHSFELLMEKSSTPVQASYHRVRKIETHALKADRFTFGSYIGPRWDQDLYQFSEGRVRPVQSFIEFQKQKAAEMGYEFHPKVDSVHR
ncbi:2OG-Fe(II) oxygenase family protein [Pseudomonas sp. KFB-139]|uniref:2OG-Fe(II) oxygenase family protein n=1 Tax=Pseudomonas serbiensis TaxID=3064350 RepID=A0ABT9CI85_9PSED|nr:2OG-Fe(II) oxygenase family protein [Pseudomonas sp. KFB-138]MDO7925198.1 2OG-Fe(II) oxygenase family protein [Pseudomonas sp. KFB-138]